MRFHMKVLTLLLSAVAALGLLVAPSPAPAPAAPTIGLHEAARVGPAGAKYLGRWVGHTRNVSFNSNGWGYMTIFSGAMHGAKHLISWGPTRTGGIRVRLHKRVQTWGQGVPMRSGTVHYGRLVKSPSNGNVYLDLARGSTYCHDKRFGYAPECGA